MKGRGALTGRACPAATIIPAAGRQRHCTTSGLGHASYGIGGWVQPGRIEPKWQELLAVSPPLTTHLSVEAPSSVGSDYAGRAKLPLPPPLPPPGTTSSTPLGSGQKSTQAQGGVPIPIWPPKSAFWPALEGRSLALGPSSGQGLRCGLISPF